MSKCLETPNRATVFLVRAGWSCKWLDFCLGICISSDWAFELAWLHSVLCRGLIAFSVFGLPSAFLLQKVLFSFWLHILKYHKWWIFNWFLLGGVFLVGVFFGSKDKSPETIEEPCLVSMKSHLDLIENTSFENDHCHSVSCVVNHTAHGKLPDQLNVNITAKSKPVQ